MKLNEDKAKEAIECVEKFSAEKLREFVEIMRELEGGKGSPYTAASCGLAAEMFLSGFVQIAAHLQSDGGREFAKLLSSRVPEILEWAIKNAETNNPIFDAFSLEGGGDGDK